MTPLKLARPGTGPYCDPKFVNGVATTPANLAESISGCKEELSALARIGAGAPQANNEISLAGFDRLVPDLQRGPVLEAHLDEDGRVVVQPATGKFPEPTGYKTVVAGVGRDQVTYTAARHWVDGANRFGQDGADFPFCLVNLPAWRRTPCDLRHAEWYRSEEDAVAKYAPPPEPDWAACVATFPRGVQVELRRENSSRWLMWEVSGRRKRRRTDFASPSLDHAKRTAELWFGEPIGDWVESKYDKAALSHDDSMADRGLEGNQAALWNVDSMGDGGKLKKADKAVVRQQTRRK